MDINTYLKTFLPPQESKRCLAGNQLSRLCISVAANIKADAATIRKALVANGYTITNRNGIEYVNVKPEDIADSNWLIRQPHANIYPEKMARILEKREIYKQII